MGQIEGPFAAQLTSGEQFGLNSLQQSAFGQGGVGQATGDYLVNALSGGQQNPFLAEAIDSAVRPVIENAQLQELRDRASFTGAGHTIQASSPFVQERGRQVSNTENAIGGIASQLAFQDAQARRAAQVQAASQAGEFITQQREAISALALPRMIEQLGIDGANQEMTRRFAEVERAISQMAAISTPTLATNADNSGMGVSVLNLLSGNTDGSSGGTT